MGHMVASRKISFLVIASQFRQSLTEVDIMSYIKIREVFIEMTSVTCLFVHNDPSTKSTSGTRGLWSFSPLTWP